MKGFRIAVASVLAAVGVGAAALTGSTLTQAAPSPQGMATTEVAVALKDFSLSPRNVAVAANQTVRFTVSNEGPRPHAMAIKGQGMESASAQIAMGETTVFEVTFANAGTYHVWCPVGSHRDQGMVSTLTVSPEGETPAVTTQVELDDRGSWAVRPFAMTMIAGQANRIDLRNVGRFNHDLVIQGMRTRLASDVLASGESMVWDVTLVTPGTYEIYCSVVVGTNSHRDLGMTGILEVLPGSPGVQMMSSGT